MGGVICISEDIDISPVNLDSSLGFFQSSVSHDVLCIEVNSFVLVDIILVSSVL